MNIELILKDLGIGGKSGSGVIKSIQFGKASWDSLSSMNIAINTVDVGKSIIIVSSGTITTYDSSVDNASTGYLVDSTTIKLERGATTSVSWLEFSWMVIEFEGVKSKQSGSVGYSSWIDNDGINISTVDRQKSVLFYNFRPTENATGVSSLALHTYLDTNSHIQVYPFGAKVFRWELLEFN